MFALQFYTNGILKLTEPSDNFSELKAIGKEWDSMSKANMYIIVATEDYLLLPNGKRKIKELKTKPENENDIRRISRKARPERVE